MDFLFGLWNKNWVRLLVVTFLVIAGFKVLLPFAGPFFPAFLVVCCLQPLFTCLHKKTGIPKGILAAGTLVLFTLFLGLLLWLAWISVGGILEEAGELLVFFGDRLAMFFYEGMDYLEMKLHLKDGVLASQMTESMNRLLQDAGLVVGERAVGISYSYVEKLISVIIYITFLVIGILLLVRDYDGIIRYLSGQKWFDMFRRIGRRLFSLGKVYLRAQFIILGCVSALCIAGLWVCGIKNPILWGLIAGILDIFPFIGTGMVLIPLGLVAILFGNYWALPMGILLYAATTFLRHLLEPKLVGDKLDIYPVLLLFSVFIGISLFKIGGIFLGPVCLFLIKEIYREVKIPENV